MLPKGGIDIQDEPVYWSLQTGASRCWSLREFHEAAPSMLASTQIDEAYAAVGQEFHFDVLGVAPEIEITELRNDPGSLADKRWLQLQWSMPQSENEKCWWLANPNDDPSKPPSLLCRSLLCMQLELNQSRVASTTKLRQTYERRYANEQKIFA